MILSSHPSLACNAQVWLWKEQKMMLNTKPWKDLVISTWESQREADERIPGQLITGSLSRSCLYFTHSFSFRNTNCSMKETRNFWSSSSSWDTEKMRWTTDNLLRATGGSLFMAKKRNLTDVSDFFQRENFCVYDLFFLFFSFLRCSLYSDDETVNFAVQSSWQEVTMDHACKLMMPSSFPLFWFNVKSLSLSYQSSVFSCLKILLKKRYGSKMAWMMLMTH